MELKGRECCDVLAMHSLFQDFEKDDLDGKIKSCKMHDIVHDFAQFLRKSGRVEATRMDKKTCQSCDPLLVSTVNEFCSLLWNKESPPNLCDCLTRLRVLRLRKCGLQSIPQGMENLIHLRWLNLRENTLSREDLKIIFQLYNLQTRNLRDCSLEEIPREIRNLIHLRHLDLSENNSLKELPREIGNLIHLRHLDLNWNKSLKELHREIGNLIHLRYLDLRWNLSLKELPREIGSLIHLRHLDLSSNESLKELPESLGGLHDLRTLVVEFCKSLCELPDRLAQLTGLRRLSDFHGESGWNKLGLLKKLNHLSGSLTLNIRLAGDNFQEMVEDAREAELRNKIHIQTLHIWFQDEMDEKEESSSVRMDVIDALEPHPNLINLGIWGYKGSELPLGWMVSPLNQLREVFLSDYNHLTSLPPLGKLPCLEVISISWMRRLQFVRREFLGITTTTGGDMDIQSSSNTIIAFPKLKKLSFCYSDLKEWEGITAEEEESADMLLMPCLTYLRIECCEGLTVLPHRLLRKASSLQLLDISQSTQLKQRYGDKNGSEWKSISQNNPCLQLKLS